MICRSYLMTWLCLLNQIRMIWYEQSRRQYRYSQVLTLRRCTIEWVHAFKSIQSTLQEIRPFFQAFDLFLFLIIGTRWRSCTVGKMLPKEPRLCTTVPWSVPIGVFWNVYLGTLYPNSSRFDCETPFLQMNVYISTCCFCRFLSCGAWAGKLFCMVMIIDYLLWRLLELLQVYYILCYKIWMKRTISKIVFSW